jgi:hypothetical protein
LCGTQRDGKKGAKEERREYRKEINRRSGLFGVRQSFLNFLPKEKESDYGYDYRSRETGGVYSQGIGACAGDVPLLGICL